jgi:hypothetical protein
VSRHPYSDDESVARSYDDFSDDHDVVNLVTDDLPPDRDPEHALS